MADAHSCLPCTTFGGIVLSCAASLPVDAALRAEHSGLKVSVASHLLPPPPSAPARCPATLLLPDQEGLPEGTRPAVAWQRSAAPRGRQERRPEEGDGLRQRCAGGGAGRALHGAPPLCCMSVEEVLGCGSGAATPRAAVVGPAAASQQAGGLKPRDGWRHCSHGCLAAFAQWRGFDDKDKWHK